MAKNKKNNGLFDVSDLAKNAQKNIEERNATQYTHNTHDTQGVQRKQKHPRINLAFYGDNLERAKEAAWLKKISVTEYINQLIVDDTNRRIAAPAHMEQLSIDDVE